MLDIQPKASGFASLNSCTGQRKDGNIHSRHVKELLGFFSFPFVPGNFLHCHWSLNICFWLSSRALESYANSFHRRRNTPIWEWTKVLTLLQKAEIPLLMRIKVKSSSLIAGEGPWNSEPTILVPIYFHLSTEVISDGTSAVNASRLHWKAVVYLVQIWCVIMYAGYAWEERKMAEALMWYCEISHPDLRASKWYLIVSLHLKLCLNLYHSSLQCDCWCAQNRKSMSSWHQPNQ